MKHAPDAFVFMKVGDHAGETFEQILARKNKEFQDAGRIFWGYGGTACHPLNQVQPFVKLLEDEMGSVSLLMEPIHSNANPLIAPATQFSSDGVHWEDIPDGISVTGSRYALVLGEIKPVEFDIDTNLFEVGAGPSTGKVATDYMRGRIDKACLISSKTVAAGESKRIRKIGMSAELIAPYAVLVRNDE